MSRPHSAEESGHGEDSFLDTMANLVGIMIILVVIVGSKTKLDSENHNRELMNKDRSQELQEPRQDLAAVEQSLVGQTVNVYEYELETQYRRLERQALLERVVLTRDMVKDKLNELDDSQRKTVEEEGQVANLQSEYDRVVNQLGATNSKDRPQIVLEHLPTPMAKTVFQKELHIILKDGRVTVVPWDKLIEMLKQQIPLAAQRQSSRNKLEDKLGPVGGFIMTYRMAAIPGGFELDRFELDMTPAAPTETIDEALQATSRLMTTMAGRNPRETVVTVWVYPESFDDFRRIKTTLFSEGFLCAARPLPDGIRVGASPQGSRSSAQ